MIRKILFDEKIESFFLIFVRFFDVEFVKILENKVKMILKI